jgi:hypothetical protein
MWESAGSFFFFLVENHESGSVAAADEKISYFCFVL